MKKGHFRSGNCVCDSYVVETHAVARMWRLRSRDQSTRFSTIPRANLWLGFRKRAVSLRAALCVAGDPETGSAEGCRWHSVDWSGGETARKTRPSFRDYVVEWLGAPPVCW
jgi:hypothetical protein